MEAFNECLQAMKSGKICDVDMNVLKEKLKTPDEKALGLVQYALHGLCIKENYAEIPVEFVQEIVDICYTPDNLNVIKMMNHLVASVAAIMLFFVRKGEFSRAVQVGTILDHKCKQVKKSLACSNADKDNLLVIHNCLLQISLKQTNRMSRIDLLQKSLTPLQHISTEDQKLYKKVQKNLMIAFKGLQSYEKKLSNCVEKASLILRQLSGKSDVNHWLLDLLTLKMCYNYSTKFTEEILEMVHCKWKEEITEILRMTNLTKLNQQWMTVVEFSTQKKSPIQDFLSSVEKILQSSGKEEKKRACLILPALFIPDRLDGHSTENLKLLYDHFLVKIFESLPEFRKIYTIRCDNAHVCQLETFSYAALTMMHLFRLNLKKNVAKCTSTIPMMVTSFKMASDCLDEMVHNNCGTEIRSQLWSQLVVRVANSIEDVMTICTKNNRWEPLRDICGCLVPLIAKSKIPLPIDQSRLSAMFERWYYACQKMNNTVGSLLARATQIWQCPWDMDWAMASWVKTKMTDKRLTGYIFCDFLKLYNKDLLLDVPANAKEFFIAEMRAYSAMPSADNDDPMIRTWTSFKSLKPNLFDSAYALSCLTVSLVKDVSPALTNQYIMECRQHLTQLSKIKKDQPDSKVKAMCYEGLLKFALFSCYLRQSQKKEPTSEARSLVLNLLKAEAKEKAKYGEDVDTNLTCDVVPQSPHLTISEEANMLAAIEQALAAWLPVPDAWTPDCLQKFEIVVTLEHIRLIANTAALFGDSRLTCKAWMLYYRIARLVDDSVAELLALSMLIKECGVLVETNLVHTAKECLKKIENDVQKNEQSHIEVLVIFQLVLTESLLLDSQYESAAETLKCCHEYIRHLRSETEYHMLKGWYLCQMSKLLFAKPEMAEMLENRDVQRTAYKAFTSLKSALKIGTDRSLTTKQQGQLLLTMLDVSLWCSDLFFVFLLTPYVRAFLEDLYIICQNLGLTSRTSQLLNILTQVDLAAKSSSDAQIKLNTLVSMLELSPLTAKEVMKTNNKLTPHSKATLEPLSPLRCQPPSINKSPLPSMLPSKVQNSRKHSDTCMCHLCSNGFFQLLTITTRSCEGVAAALAGDNKTAHLYHKHCNDLITNFNIEKYSSILMIELDVCFPGVIALNIQKKFYVTAARSKLNYANFALLPDSHCRELSTKLLQDTDDIIAGLTFQKNLIQWECLELIACDYIFEETAKYQTNWSAAMEGELKQSYDKTKTPYLSQNVEKMMKSLSAAVFTAGLAAPKRGRRIFEDDLVGASAKSKISDNDDDDEKTPVDSDCEIPGTPSPEIKSTCRRVRLPRRAKPVPLVFDETQDKEIVNVSNDIFESFDALRISEPVMEKKKTTNGKKNGKKKETTTAKKKPAKTARL